jgi:hypothetical protein
VVHGLIADAARVAARSSVRPYLVSSVLPPYLAPSPVYGLLVFSVTTPYLSPEDKSGTFSVCSLKIRLLCRPHMPYANNGPVARTSRSPDFAKNDAYRPPPFSDYYPPPIPKLLDAAFRPRHLSGILRLQKKKQQQQKSFYDVYLSHLLW